MQSWGSSWVLNFANTVDLLNAGFVLVGSWHYTWYNFEPSLLKSIGLSVFIKINYGNCKAVDTQFMFS